MYSQTAKDAAWRYLRELLYIPCRDQFDIGTDPKIYVVMHEMVAPERSDMAESLGGYFRDPRNPDGSQRPASTHFGVDNDSAVRYAEFYRKVYGAAGMNYNGWHIEQAGLATQDAIQWMDAYSKAMLDKQASKLTAALCIIDDIPVVYVDQNGIRAGQHGITTHAECWKVYGGDYRSDPVNYPMAYFIDRVKEWVPYFEGENLMTPQEFAAWVTGKDADKVTPDDFTGAIALKNWQAIEGVLRTQARMAGTPQGQGFNQPLTTLTDLLSDTDALALAVNLVNASKEAIAEAVKTIPGGGSVDEDELADAIVTAIGAKLNG